MTVHERSDRYLGLCRGSWGSVPGGLSGPIRRGFGKLETRRAKALLQPILHAVHVLLKGRLKVEFRV